MSAFGSKDFIVEEGRQNFDALAHYYYHGLGGFLRSKARDHNQSD